MIGYFVHLLLSYQLIPPLLCALLMKLAMIRVFRPLLLLSHICFFMIVNHLRQMFLSVFNVRMALRQARNRGFVSPQRVAMLADAADVPCSSQPSLMPSVRTPYFDAGQCSTASVGVSSHPSTSQSSLIPNVRTALRQACARVFF